MKDFFISYTGADEAWAEWIAWVVEAAGFTIILQKWDFRPGSNFVLEMQRAAANCTRTIAVLSAAYLKSAFAAPEWASGLAGDPEGLKRTLVPVRIAECRLDGLLKAIVYVDLVGLDEENSRRVLLEGLEERRAKPILKPNFPGKPIPVAPAFPGTQSTATSKPARSNEYMPKIHRAPSDLDKRRFFRTAFETIEREFKRRLDQLTLDNAEVETDLTPIDNTKFIAEIFVGGNSRARCKIWQGGMFGSEGISYAEGHASQSEGSINDILTLAESKDELALSATMSASLGRQGEGLDVKRLNPYNSAEYLWRRFTWTLES